MTEETQPQQQRQGITRSQFLNILKTCSALAGFSYVVGGTFMAYNQITGSGERTNLNEFMPENDRFKDIKKTVSYDYNYNGITYENGGRYTEYSTNPNATTVLYKIPGSRMHGPNSYFPYNDELGIAAKEFGIDARFIHIPGNSHEDDKSPDGINTQGSGAQAEAIAAAIAESFGKYDEILIDAESMGAAGLFEALPRIAEKLNEYYTNNPNAKKIGFKFSLNSPVVNARDVLFNLGKIHEDIPIFLASNLIDLFGTSFALSTEERAIEGIKALRSVNDSHPRGMGGMVDILITASRGDKTVPISMIESFDQALASQRNIPYEAIYNDSDAHVPHLLPRAIAGTMTPEQYHRQISDKTIRGYLNKLINNQY